jgi:diguanylate cyclase (GGDEF)-like protein
LWQWWLLSAIPLVLLSPLAGPDRQEFVYLLLGFGAAVAAVLGLFVHRSGRSTGWYLMTAALCCGATATIVWAVEAAFGVSHATLGVVDVLYFAIYPLFAAALAALPDHRSGTSRWTGATEAGIVVCSGAVLCWVLLFDPYVRDADTPVPLSPVMAYPVLDLLIIGMAVRLLVVQIRLTRGHLLVFAAAALLCASDVTYFISVMQGGTLAGPQFSVMGWAGAFVLCGAAALHPRSAVDPDEGPARPDGWRVALVHLSLVAVGPIATLISLVHDHAEGELDPWDFALPLSASAIIAMLLVVRLTVANRITARHAASLRHLALHDALTGLPNRIRLEELLGETETGALLLLDLDGFKDVNDRLGHKTGDALLVAVAGRLRNLLGPGEVLARPGGDEFGILLPGADKVSAAARAEAALDVLRAPVELGADLLHVTGSAGIRMLDLSTAGQLLGDADLAMYAAKAAGRDTATVFDPRLRDEQAERVRTVQRLRGALADGEFRAYYQPIVDLDSGVPVAVEALVRWLPPGQPPILPDTFIPAAEDSGLIVGLGEWVLRQACADAAVWNRRYGTVVTVNVSPRQLTDPEFTAKVRRALADSGLPAGALTLEITEGVLVRSGTHAEQALEHLSALRADGVKVAVDDFGTGYSSLAYLRDLPIDILKIDRSFMPADSSDCRQAALVRAVVDLARGLQLTTVAEGVETTEHADLLRSLGCDRGQGYLFARPAPAADVSARLEAAMPVPAAA